LNQGNVEVYGSQLVTPKYNQDIEGVQPRATDGRASNERESQQNPMSSLNEMTSHGEKRRVMIYTEEDNKAKAKKKQRPLTAQEKALKKKTSDFNATTRWLADSSFTTYFGKPAFHAYGKGNVKPANPAYKMLTHNINGCTGKQSTQFQQVYDSAYLAGLDKTKGVRVPQIPIQKEQLAVVQPSESAMANLP